MPSQQDVRHDPAQQRFWLGEKGGIVHLDYRTVKDSALDFAHTFTPPELRGQGLAAIVTRAALEYARDNGYKVRPSCPYVDVYMRRHPEFQELRLE